MGTPHQRPGPVGDMTVLDVEVKRQAGYSYNPPYDDLDACALAYNIASLLNAINQAFRLMNARPVWRNNQSLQASDQTIGSSLRLRLHVRFDKEEKAEVVTNCDHAKNLRFSPSYRSPTMAPSSQQRDATLSGRLPSATGKLGRLADYWSLTHLLVSPGS